MDNKSRGNHLTTNDIETIKSRIIETCKHIDTDFTINTQQLTKQINYLFNCSYSTEDVNYVLGFLYEEQFYYNLQETYDIRF